jgi:hypothetical protein
VTRISLRIVLVVASILLAAASAARAADDPLRIQVELGAQLDRLHSVLADSVGLSNSHGPVAALSFDFRVFSVPMAGEDKPALHVLGDVVAARRVFPMRDFAGAGFTGAPVAVLPVVELITGVELTLPMTLLDKGAGSAFLLGYRGGLLLSNGGLNDFPHVKQVVFGFERTRGLFEHSSVEMAYGTNEAVGRRYGAHRWGSRVLLMAQVGTPAVAVTPKAAPGKAAPSAPPASSPVHLFLEFDIDTDGSVGPDVLMTRTGVTLDAGRVLSRVLGAIR